MALSYLRYVDQLTRVNKRDTAELVLVKAMAELFQPKSVKLFLVTGPHGDVRCLQLQDWAEGEMEPVSNSAWTAWETAKPLTAWDGAAECLDSGETLAIAMTTGHALLLPIRNGNGEHRLLWLEFEHPVDPQIKLMAEAFVGIYRNYLDLLDYSERDTLTGLLNRKSFDETFMKAAQQLFKSTDPSEQQSSGQRQVRASALFWLGVIDVDHFKRVNDEFGHLIGDEVLLLLAGLMRSAFRHTDRLYRFGGEEFVVLIRASEPQYAELAFERFRTKVEETQFPQVGKVTVSIGYTQLTQNDTPTAAFERADKVVYLSKSNGRNQIQNYESALSAELVTGGSVISDLEEF